VSLATQAAYAKQALTIAKNDPNVQMFIWFVFRDSAGNPWQSGLFSAGGASKPAYSTFSAVARLIDGTMSQTKLGGHPTVTMYMPYLSHFATVGAQIGVTYKVYDGTSVIAAGQPVALLASDQSIHFTPVFTTVKGRTYTVTAVANEANGHTEQRSAFIRVV